MRGHRGTVAVGAPGMATGPGPLVTVGAAPPASAVSEGSATQRAGDATEVDDEARGEEVPHGDADAHGCSMRGSGSIEKFDGEYRTHEYGTLTGARRPAQGV